MGTNDPNPPANGKLSLDPCSFSNRHRVSATVLGPADELLSFFLATLTM